MNKAPECLDHSRRSSFPRSQTSSFLNSVWERHPRNSVSRLPREDEITKGILMAVEREALRDWPRLFGLLMTAAWECSEMIRILLRITWRGVQGSRRPGGGTCHAK